MIGLFYLRPVVCCGGAIISYDAEQFQAVLEDEVVFFGVLPDMDHAASFVVSQDAAMGAVAAMAFTETERPVEDVGCAGIFPRAAVCQR